MKSALGYPGLVLMLILLAGCAEPDFLDTEGNGHFNADYAGKWRVVNYWATWCAPCIAEIPELNHLASEEADRLVVFGVNFDNPEGAEAQAQVARMKIAFPVYAQDPARTLGIDTPQVLPTTVIVAPDGQVRAVLVGPQTQASILAAIEPGPRAQANAE